jgi:hypothetical protein
VETPLRQHLLEYVTLPVLQKLPPIKLPLMPPLLPLPPPLLPPPPPPPPLNSPLDWAFQRKWIL